jgi:enamine deaminase RidA (YjgF/YER057c/UK114 family)
MAGQIEARLAELGFELPNVTPPLAAYVPALRTHDLVFVSGQLPMVDGTLLATGTVGVEVSADDAKQFAQRCALNALAALKTVIADLDEVEQVVKVIGFVACGPNFTAHPSVINGASEFLGTVFGDAGRHARSAVGVASLPLGAPVEVEFTFRIRA